jgi:hypothetical protein
VNASSGLIRRPLTPPRPRGFERPVSLSDVLDRVLNKGVVVAGEVVISLAGVDLAYIALNLLVSSVETALKPGVDPRPQESLDAAE